MQVREHSAGEAKKQIEAEEDPFSLTTYQIYKAIDENSNVFEFDMDGQKFTFLGTEYGNNLYGIENLMKDVRDGKRAFAVEKTKHGGMKPLALAKYLPRMKGFLNMYSPSKVYSPSVELFYDVCVTKYGLMPNDFCNSPDTYSPVFKMKQGEFLNKLIEDFTDAMSKREFKRKVYARTDAIVRGRASGEEYVGALFDRWARLLVLRVDFGFRTSDPLMPHTVSLQEAQEHLARFFNNRRGKRLYVNLKGYVWRLEYGREKGYHFHLIFFFDGSKSHKDEYIASEIGADWIKVTEGQGIYHNCNAHKQRYKRLGIGMISHDDEEKRRNLLNVLAYMYKEDQTLREKHTIKTHGWGRGTMPTARAGKSGRPRRTTKFH